jgi:GDP/UDP-N,N'-diacetylbacillosamine 2-epimerase (hydrolysing)
MKIGVLTSSRADFGIYIPLLNVLRQDNNINLKIIAFGTHLSMSHGYTVTEIVDQGFTSIDKIQLNFSDDSPKGISKTYAETCLKFADYWSKSKFDLVFCLGDRFEMQAAVQVGIPLRVRFAHVHGGETTEGAIDNVYRHQITLASSVHFASTELYAQRIKEIVGSGKYVYNVGSLSLDELDQLKLPTIQSVCKQFLFPEKDFILATFHPETVSVDMNESYVNEMGKSLRKLLDKYQIVITMPNADTMGSLYRSEILRIAAKYDNLYIVESFGKLNYFTAMKNALCILGNSSSGIIEAASFKKYVINVGDRQKGRMQSKNILNSSFDAIEIVNQVESAVNFGDFNGKNIYYKKDVAKSILKLINKELANA